jgi:hypothetical protein
MKTHLPFFLCAIFATVLRGAEPAKLSEADSEGLMQKARALHAAFETGDADGVIRLTHPAMRNGRTREQWEAWIRDSVKELSRLAKFEKTEWGVPSPLYDLGAEELTFVPTAHVGQVAGLRVFCMVFFIAVRKKGTNEWLFMDGAPLRENPALLWQLFPELPKDVVTPPNTLEVLK